MKAMRSVSHGWRSDRAGLLSDETGRALLTFVIGCIALLAGCATAPSNLSVLDDTSTLETLPMIALEGYRDGTNFFVKYSLGGRILYSGGNWRERQSTPWEAIPEDAVKIPIFGVEQWQLLRNRLLRAVVPADGTGLVVDFGHAEYFLYYDKGGEFNATRLQDKPSNYRVQSVLRFDEFMRRVRVQYRG
jgi:hypothetical protein